MNAGRIFAPLLYNLRAQGVKVGLSEWLAFLDGLDKGLARNLDEVYRLARSLLVHNEAAYDAFDLAFSATFAGVELEARLKEALETWLKDPVAFEQLDPGKWGFNSLEELMKAFEETLKQQKERHDRGNRWVGTGGTSPFGHGGKANMGVLVGGDGGGGTAVQVAGERRWAEYRTDTTLEIRDFKVALRALRTLVREGHEVLDIDETIEKTGKNAGEIELVFRPDKANRIRLLLLMDTGGSMTPHAHLVSRLFTAANEMKTFKSFEHYFFHNCIYGWLFKSYATYERRPTAEVLANLTHEHRVIIVGDASMAPWELFANAGGWGDDSPSGLEWLRRFKAKVPGSVWLNPDPPKFWDHPTVSAIGQVFPMYPLTIEGLRGAVRTLRAAPGV